MTKYWTVSTEAGPAEAAIQEAGRLLREGKLVAFPTETVYGLGADARSDEAVAGIFTAKGRPSDNPLIVHIAELAELDAIVERVEPMAERLMAAFWPGPLAIVLPARPGAVSPRVTAGLATVAVRMPDHAVARSLIAAAGCPVAAPSANRSGRPSPTRAAHVRDDLDGRIDGVLDGGPTGVGLESTVVELAGGALHILRPGGVSAAALQAALPGVPVREAGHAEGAGAAAGEAPEPEVPRAPGMKYAHYAPQGRLVVVEGDDPARVAARIRQEAERAAERGERTGILCRREHAASYRADSVIACGSDGDPEEAARNLYDALRAFDDAGTTFILAEGWDEQGIGRALMNRLRKAAGNEIMRV